MKFNTDGNPSTSALYLVDRGMQGKYYRYYNADTDQWGMCGADMNEAVTNKDKTAVGFYPWVGPLTGPNFKASKPVAHVSNTDNPVDFPKASKPAKKRMAKSPAAPKVKAPKQPKQTYEDGTVFYRADRGKWVAVWAGKQEAARPTAEACLAFLKKKYNHTGVVLPKPMD